MNNPEFIEINNKKIKINTDYRVALKCNQVAIDDTIGDYERAYAILYLLYGDEGLNKENDLNKMLQLAMKYLSCGEERKDEQEEQDMDFEQDFNLIRASFKSDYGIDLLNENMHWWDFYTYINGLKEDCILNRIRELRTYDLSEIKDTKTRKKIKEQKERFALKKKYKITKQQQENVDTFYELTGIKRKE